MLPAQVIIRTATLPDNTPYDAALYLASDLNEWVPGHPSWMFTQLDSQVYEISIPNPPDSFAFKITRGNWNTVEGRDDGQARRNRVYTASQYPNGIINLDIESWEDLNGNGISWYNFLLLLSAFQGFLLILAINGIQNNNVRANRRLSLIIFLISIALIGRAITFDREFFNWQPKLFLIPEWILFLFAPLFFYYLRELLKLEAHHSKEKLQYFIPAILHVLAFVPAIFMAKEEFKMEIVDESLHPWFAVAGALALPFNAWFWWKCWTMIDRYEHESRDSRSVETPVPQLKSVMVILACCIAAWLFAYVASGLGSWSDWTTKPIVGYAVNLTWVIFSGTNFFLGYLAIHQPEILRLPKPVTKYKDTPLADDEMVIFQQRLTKAMEEDKIYLRSELTLSDLAEHVRTNTHTISRVLNEGLGQSFYDFINTYRVKEFTRMVAENDYPGDTYLAIALQSGFNSKTTFNRAFKKVTGMPPRQYFQENPIPEKPTE
ncbi:MAG: helix-turn-helix domain-containing protein [Bacteroidia bacterium]|nr:helix-turn-helix domain-containing protein [Bacteroidia bacterium]